MHSKHIRKIVISLFISLFLTFQSWATPLPPLELPVEIQQEFIRIYETTDAALPSQLSPMLELFPEYREQLVRYLGVDANLKRQSLVADLANASERERDSWFNRHSNKIIGTSAILAGIAIANSRSDTSSDSKNTKTPDPIKPQIPIPIPIDPAQFRTAEFNANWGNAAIKAEHAYARGATGEGIIVAVVDTGVDIDHMQLANNITPGGDVVRAGGPRMTDMSTHGTHVAGTIAAVRDGQGMHGIAPESQILPVKVFGEDGLNARQNIDRQIEVGVNISNNSWSYITGPVGAERGYTIDDMNDQSRENFRNNVATIYAEAVRSGIIFVFSAGNNGSGNLEAAANPQIMAALPLLAPELQGQWLAVVNIRDNGTISNGSHRCGHAQAWCLAAPGSAVYSTTPGNEYGFKSGTSMAAPHVSGALALLMDLFPTLTPAQITERALVSADKSGIYADSATYGQGLIDLQAASNPIGGLFIEVASGQILSLDEVRMNESPAMGNALMAALSKFDLVLKDDLNAPFVLNAEILQQEQGHKRIDTNSYLQRLEQENNTHQVNTDDGLQLRYSNSNNTSSHSKLGNVQALKALGKDTEISASLNTDTSWSQGLLRMQPLLQNNSMTQAFSNPYLSLDSPASGAGLHWTLDDNWHSAVQVNVSSVSERFDDRSSGKKQHSLQTEWAYHADNGLHASLQLGLLNEQQRLLGSQSDGWIGEGQTNTWFGGVNLSLPLSENWQMFGRYNTGLSQLDGGRWLESGRLRSDSFTVGMFGQSTPQLQYGALVYQPLRLRGGKTSMQLSTRLNADNSVSLDRVNLQLKAEGRHMEYELFMRYELPAWQLSFKGSMLHIVDYQNQPGNNESLLMINAGLQY